MEKGLAELRSGDRQKQLSGLLICIAALRSDDSKGSVSGDARGESGAKCHEVFNAAFGTDGALFRRLLKAESTRLLAAKCLSALVKLDCTLACDPRHAGVVPALLSATRDELDASFSDPVNVELQRKHRIAILESAISYLVSVSLLNDNALRLESADVSSHALAMSRIVCYGLQEQQLPECARLEALHLLMTSLKYTEVLPLEAERNAVIYQMLRCVVEQCIQEKEQHLDEQVLTYGFALPMTLQVMAENPERFGWDRGEKRGGNQEKGVERNQMCLLRRALECGLRQSMKLTLAKGKAEQDAEDMKLGVYVCVHLGVHLFGRRFLSWMDLDGNSTQNALPSAGSPPWLLAALVVQNVATDFRVHSSLNVRLLALRAFAAVMCALMTDEQDDEENDTVLGPDTENEQAVLVYTVQCVEVLLDQADVHIKKQRETPSSIDRLLVSLCSTLSKFLCMAVPTLEDRCVRVLCSALKLEVRAAENEDGFLEESSILHAIIHDLNELCSDTVRARICAEHGLERVLYELLGLYGGKVRLDGLESSRVRSFASLVDTLTSLTEIDGSTVDRAAVRSSVEQLVARMQVYIQESTTERARTEISPQADARALREALCLALTELQI
ncbi:hypothetical protein FVE85_6640 [Porphyridium purpureum]|uniref:Neurochondrin n=1 Tax=Porphyridium purpureum TaxID=35688 RepID=A0A5J4Z6V6_PORPP|nr:hypothetical protein FVE85_6640 [Porphyridium purpureum]|eukprot:POR0245..scf295_1